MQGKANSKTQAWIDKIEQFQGIHIRVIDQIQRRVYNEENVPAAENFVSIFEPHTDIIVKGERDVLYGHKINLATQQDGFITYLWQGQKRVQRFCLGIHVVLQPDTHCAFFICMTQHPTINRGTRCTELVSAWTAMPENQHLIDFIARFGT